MDLKLAGFVFLLIAGVSAQDTDTTTPGQVVCTVAGELFPVEDNCQEFWFCNSELVPYLYTCAAGQYFDSDLLSCNPEETVNCGSRATPTTVTEATTTTAATAATTSPGQIVCTVAGELFPNQANCQEFWFCNTDLVPYVYTCAAGEYFDEDQLSCNPEETVNCGSRATPSTTTTTPAPTTSPGQIVCTVAGELFPDQANCQDFWFCNTDLVPYVYTCANGEYFDEDTLSCNPEATVDCGSRPTPSTSTAVPTPSAGQNCDYVSELLPDCSDCNAFFECDALLNPVYMECPAGEYFSVADNDCQDSGNVNCVDGARPDYNDCP